MGVSSLSTHRPSLSHPTAPGRAKNPEPKERMHTIVIQSTVADTKDDEVGTRQVVLGPWKTMVMGRDERIIVGERSWAGRCVGYFVGS